jgi:CheY-like chemotaxis protein
MNGFELLRNLMLDETARPQLLIAVSALTRDEMAALGDLPEGVQLFSKPVQKQRFMAALRAAV